MDAIRDVLDNQLIDRQGRPMGKVDGLIMESRSGKPPRLVCLELGATTLAYRLHPRFGKLAKRIAKKWGVRRDGPLRIDFAKVTDIGIDVKVDLEADETSALVWEYWLRERVIARLPWGK